jgi:hypothetical protein
LVSSGNPWLRATMESDDPADTTMLDGQTGA